MVHPRRHRRRVADQPHAEAQPRRVRTQPSREEAHREPAEQRMAHLRGGFVAIWSPREPRDSWLACAALKNALKTTLNISETP